MIYFDHICKSYKNTIVLNDISFQINTGELVAIIGPSGCGKTTLLKMINKLINPTSGTILIDGTDIKTLSTAMLRRKIGYVIQQTGLFTHMTVGKNIGIIPYLQKEDKDVVKRKIYNMLELVGLPPEDFYSRYPLQLSGGQQQRVGVARAFIIDPDIILMDEPFSALDPLTRLQLQEELIKLHQKLKKTIIFVTHDIDEALKIANRICILHNGKVEQYATPEELLLRPQTAYVSDFIGKGRVWNFPQYLTIGNIMHNKISICHESDSLDSLSIPELPNNLYVINDSRHLVGVISSHNLPTFPHKTASEIMDTNFPVLSAETNLKSALSYIERSTYSHIPVVSNSVPVGFISCKSVISNIFQYHTGRESDII